MSEALVYAPELVFKKGTKEMSYKPVGTVQKSPAENLRLECYFVDSESGMPLTVSAATIIALDSKGVDVTAQLIEAYSISGASGLVYVHLQGGVDKGSYIVKVQASTSASPLMEMSISVKVRDPKA